MGITESLEEVNHTLGLLATLSNQEYRYTLVKLEELAKQKFQMQVSKWDLALIMQRKQIEIKRIMQMITRKAEPENVAIHNLMIALVFARKSGSVASKMLQILELKSELRYMFHLFYYYIEVTTSVTLKDTAIQEQIEDLYFKEEDELCPIDVIADHLGKDSEVGRLCTLYNMEEYQSVVEQNSQMSKLSMGSAMKLNSSVRSGDQHSMSHHQSDKQMNAQNSSRASFEKDKIGTNGRTSKTSKTAARASAPNSPDKIATKGSTANLAVQGGLTEAKDVNLLEEHELFQRPMKQLYWNNELLPMINVSYNTKLPTYEYNHTELSKMQQKLVTLRKLTASATTSERMSNLKDLNEKYGQVERLNMEFYGQKQLNYMMKSSFFEQQLVNTGYSITEQVTTLMNAHGPNGAALGREKSTSQPALPGLDGSPGVRDDVSVGAQSAEDQMREVMCRAIASQSFKEFYKENLSSLKYETKMHQSRLLYFISNRGRRRMLEKRKYKCIGEINILSDLIKDVKQASADLQAQQNSQGLKEEPGISARSKQPTKTIEPPGIQAFKEAPTMDQLFVKVQTEFNHLRNCELSRKDLVKIIQSKENKAMSTKAIGFWEGVLTTLGDACKLKTFAELEYFKEFLQFAQNRLHEEEQMYKTCIAAQKSIKNIILNYSCQVGKMKGLDLVSQIIQSLPTQSAPTNRRMATPKSSTSSLTFFQQVQERLNVLLERLEAIDVELVSNLHEDISKKRSSNLYFKSQGQISTYRCISKGLPCERVVDYLGISVCKMRIQEIISLIASQDNFDPEYRIITDDKLFGSMLQLSKVLELDKNLMNTELVHDTPPIHEKFKEEVQAFQEGERLAQYAPDVPVLEPLDQMEEIKKDMVDTVTNMMEKFYCRHKVEATQMGQFMEFSKEMLKTPMFELTGQLTYKTLAIEDAGQVFFDFVDLEDPENKKKKSENVISWLGTLSSSLKQTYFNAQIEKLKVSMSEAHKQNRDWCESVLEYKDKQFVQEFQKERIETLKKFVLSLRGANQKHLLNNFDMQNMSLPLEYSIENNFWCTQAIHMQLNYYEKEERFSQLLQANSPILLSRRSLYLNAKIASQLILAAFSLGPQSVHGSDDEDEDDNDKDLERDRIDFEKQFTLIKGEPNLEKRVKSLLFADIQDIVSLQLNQTQIEQAVMTRLIQKRETYRDLRHLITDIYDESFEMSETADLTEILASYSKTKQDFYDNLKTNGIRGIIRGAKNFIDTLIQLQTSADSFGMNQTMLKFRDQITNILSSLETIPDDAVLNQEMNLAAGKTRNDQALLSVSTQNSGGTVTDISYAHGTAVKKEGGKKKKDRKKSKLFVKNPMQQAEHDIVVNIVKTQFFYELVHIASQCSDLNQFYTQIQAKTDQKSQLVMRYETTIRYLQQNGSRNIENREPFLQVEVDIIGCQILQDVQAGELIQHSFVYSPPNINSLGIPPLEMAKQNDSSLSNTNPQKKSVSRHPSSATAGQTTPKPAKSDCTSRPGSANEKDKSETIELSEQQKSVNLIFQFLNQICQMDDKLTSKQVLRNDLLFVYIQIAQVQIKKQRAQFQVLDFVHKGLEGMLNVFDVQQTPLEQYLKNYERISKFVNRDLVTSIHKTDEDQLKYFFFDIMSNHGESLISRSVSRVDNYFALAQLEESDKLEFGAAQTKVKRELDQNLRTFKEFVDLEENRKVAQSHKSKTAHQELRLMQELASLLLIVRTYYLKYSLSFEQLTQS